MRSVELRASIVSLTELFMSSAFRPASVQREFQWRSEQCSTLIADFERAWRASDLASDTERISDTVQDYYLGGCVLLPNEDGKFEVFDGLQRLTTLTILFSVLRDILSDESQELSKELDKLIFDEDGVARLELGGQDQTLSNLIQTRSEAVRTRRNLSANTLRARLLGAAHVFHTSLRTMSSDDIIKFATFILKRVKVALIQVPDAQLARQIFITTNNRGVPLNEADVLRSQINSIPYRQDVADRVLAAWKRVSDQFDDTDDYQNFLGAVDFITRRQGQSAEGLSQLGDYLASKLDDTQILEWLVDFESLADAWMWLQSTKHDPRPKVISGSTIVRLFVFDWPEWKPVALVFARALQDALNNGDKRRVKTLRGRFEDLGRACLGLTLADLSQTERTRLMLRALADVNARRNPADHALQFTGRLRTQIGAAISGPILSERRAVEVMRWLEIVQEKTKPTAIIAAQAQPILPARDTDDMDWGAAFSDPETRWQSVNQWGNFVLRIPPNGQSVEPAANFRIWKKKASADSVRTNALKDVLKISAWTPDVISKRSYQIRRAIESSLGL